MSGLNSILDIAKERTRISEARPMQIIQTEARRKKVGVATELNISNLCNIIKKKKNQEKENDTE